MAASLPLAWLWGFTVDDALITARVASRIAEGVGYRFDRGGPVVDAVTPLGWAYVLAPFAHRGPLGAFYFAKWFGACTAVGGAACLGARTAREPGGAWRLVVLVPLALSAPLAAWCGAGMETGVVVFLATLALGSGRLATLAAGLAAAWRPELLPWSAALSVGSVVARTEPDQRRGAALRALVLAVGPTVLVAAIRVAVFGRPVPLAFFAKPSDFAHGAFYALACLLWTGAPALVVAPWALRRLDAHGRAVLVAAAIHTVALVFAGGDWMAFFRLFVPVLPGLFLVGARLVAAARPWATAVRLVVASGMSALLLFTKGSDARGVLADRRALITGARPYLVGARSVAALDVGWVGVATDADIVDLAGITDPSIAFLHGGHTSKRIPDGLLRHRHVDHLVLLAAGPVSDGDLAGAPWARAVEARVAREAAELGFVVRATLELPKTGRRYVVLTLKDEP
ncbi:MAG TPA: hypothetical protein VH062_10115 [Polyangiaceae bacterium]|nr:hypothetical protein [Polyangiaceae bacterium]